MTSRRIGSRALGGAVTAAAVFLLLYTDQSGPIALGVLRMLAVMAAAWGVFAAATGSWFKPSPEALAASSTDPGYLGEDTQVKLRGLTEEGKREAVMASVKTLEDQIRGAIRQAVAAGRADGLALYWRPEPEGPLRLRAGGDDSIHPPQVTPGSGILGLAVENGEPVRVNGARPLRGALPHAAGAEAMLAVPVFNRQSLLGLLVAHRCRPEPFGGQEEELLRGLGEQVLEFHRHARLLHRTEEERGRLKSLAELSHRLSRTLDLDEIIRSVSHAGRALTGEATVAVVIGERDDDLVIHWSDGPETKPGTSSLDGTLLGLALRDHQRLAMPDLAAREKFTPALGPRLDPPGARSLLIQPLPFRHDARGAIVFFSPAADAFPADALEAVAMLADMAAVSFHNALMYRRMEEKAVRDGLTGLFNHRWFQERLADELERAERLRTRVALVICDLDHFKKVNDNYGHPAGDEVLRAVGRVLAASVRRTDSAARYGGEEFALILLGADAKGATELTERVRKEIGRLGFRSGGKDFRITISLGVAVYPDHARTRADLISRADKALYQAKEGGRNRTVVAE